MRRHTAFGLLTGSHKSVILNKIITYCSGTLPLSLSMQIKEEGLCVLEEAYNDNEDVCSSTPKVNTSLQYAI